MKACNIQAKYRNHLAGRYRHSILQTRARNDLNLKNWKAETKRSGLRFRLPKMIEQRAGDRR